MPRYTYLAKIDPHKNTQGYIEAESEPDAINKLTQAGYFPIWVKYETPMLDKRGISSWRKIPRREIVLFTRQLSTLIDSGINILNAFNMISRQASNKHLAVILNDVSGRIKDGGSLSDSLEAFPALFSRVYCAMIRSGEASGDMNNTLKRLADFMEEEEEFKESLRSSLAYPAFVFLVSALTVGVLLVFVIPRLVSMFEDMGQVLPMPTRILIASSGFLRNYWWVIVAGIVMLVFLFRRIYSTPQGRLSFDKFKLKMPVFGDLVLKTEVSRLMRTLSLLLSSGMPINQALDIAVTIMDNRILKTEVAKFKEQISSGSSLSSAFKSSKLFPDLVTNIVAIGEETGALDKSLMRLSQDYEGDVNRVLKGLTRLLEPVIILVMGLIVGFIVLSMLLPIFQINLIVK